MQCNVNEFARIGEHRCSYGRKRFLIGVPPSAENMGFRSSDGSVTE
jgi:hypothetical protein